MSGKRNQSMTKLQQMAEASVARERESARKCCGDCELKFEEFGQHQHRHAFILGAEAMRELAVKTCAENSEIAEGHGMGCDCAGDVSKLGEERE